jgi:hypothetical protein
MPGSIEFQLCLHVLEHRTDGCEQRYTIGVRDNRMQPPGLRALCHAQPIHEAVIAIICELTRSEERKQEAVRSPQWRVVSRLIQRLRDRDDADSHGAADEIEELFSRWHNSTGDLEDARIRLARIGCLLEEAASKAHSVASDSGCFTSVAVPEPVWSRLLAAYRTKQEGWQIYRELQLLRELAAITADTLRTIENWLGNAGTREGAMDSLWRLARVVQGFGYELPVENLTWRGQLVRALEEAGLGIGPDGVIRVRQAKDKYWQPATGPAVKTLLEHATQPTSYLPGEIQGVVNHEQNGSGD